jgi:integrase/recombinase XerD
MVQTLYEDPHALKRHLTAPLLDERLRYLIHWAERGSTWTTLRSTASCLLLVIDQLKLSEKRTITGIEMEEAAERWAHYQADLRGVKDGVLPSSKYYFIKHGTRWLDFLGWLETPASPPHPFAQFITGFIDFCREERGMTPSTIFNRRWLLEAYLGKLHDRQLSLSDLTIAHIDEISLHHLNQAKYSRRTVWGYASILRTFFRYAEQRGWCRCGLADAIKTPRLYKHETLPFSPTWEDVQQLIATASGSCPKAIRDRAILLLLAVYGLRAGEVGQLQLDDIDWEHELLNIRRVKKGPVQQLPLSHTVGEAILRYLREVRPRSAFREVFLTLRAPISPLTSATISQLVIGWWRLLDVKLEHYGPHSLRHACATKLINEGVSLKEIGDQLGHRNLDTTRIYAKVDLSHLREVADIELGGLLCD